MVAIISVTFNFMIYAIIRIFYVFYVTKYIIGRQMSAEIATLISEKHELLMVQGL